ncbi:MAG: hypothetical protein V1807_01375 [Patescibacteria group bacterium]
MDEQEQPLQEPQEQQEQLSQEPIEQPEQPIVPQSTFEPIVWQAEEFEVHRRDWRWYTILIAAFLVVGGYSWYARQWILLAMAVVVAGLLLISGRLKPRRMQYRLDSAGLHINERTLTFEQLKGFWFHNKSGKNYLNVISTFRLMPVITILINAQDLSSLRQALSQFVPEVNRQDEDWIDRINRFLKV